MTTLNIIIKAVETLKNFQEQESADSDFGARKKEKISNCITIADGVCISTIKVVPKFTHVLSLAIETLLSYCDDNDSDVRTVADECLNKIIRAMADTHILKVQIELYQEIKRNRSARCLRAALWRFGLLSHMIRAARGKAYVTNLIPCIVNIMKRKEESVIETLTQSLPLILKSLGPFMTDKDVKILLKAFFPNVSSTEATLRRSAANMIVTTCLNCRKPQNFLSYVMDNLIDTAIRVIETDKECMTTVLGIFNCFQLMLPHMNVPLVTESENAHRLENFLQIYELCLHYTKWHSNHNVINSALETLIKLLQSPQKEFLSVLLSSDGIGHSRIFLTENSGRLSLGHMSLSTTTVSGGTSEVPLNLLDSDLSEISDITPKIQKWIAESENSLPVIHRSPKQVPNDSVEMTTKILDDYNNLKIGTIGNDDLDDGSDFGSELEKSEKVYDSSVMSQHSREEEFLDDTLTSLDSPQRSLVNVSLPEFDIGRLNGTDVSLKYCCRYLASSFLLTGKVGQLITDKMFRVSVKSLALTCISHILRIYPSLLFSTVARTSTDEYQQTMSDILLYAKHSDPQLRGNVSMIIGFFLRAMLAENYGTFTSTEVKDFEIQNKRPEFLAELINLLLMGLEDESAATCRQTLNALGIFMTDLLESVENQRAIVILNLLPQIVNNPYFLVRVKLVELLSELPYITIEHATNSTQFQENVISVFTQLLGDQDQRVRSAVSAAITKIIPLLYYQQPQEDAVTRKASLHTDQYLSTVIYESLELSACFAEHKLLMNSLIKPFVSLCASKEMHYSEKIDDALSRIVNLLIDQLNTFQSKHLTYGIFESLSLLSETYFTTVYSRAWDCILSKNSSKKTHKKSSSKLDLKEINLASDMILSSGNSLLSISIVLLSSLPVSLDLALHRNLLTLAGNLASGMAVCNLKPGDPINKNETDSAKLWGLYKDKQMYQHLELLLNHVVRLLNVFVHVIDDIQLAPPASKSSLPSLPGAQSLSPKKKLIPEHKSKERMEKFPTLRFGKEQMGVFHNMTHYVKLYEILRNAHANYNVTLISEASEMYLSLLNATLQVLSQLLEMATLIEAGRIAEEILHYLQTTMLLSPTKSVQCVQQLLKCLFGTNLCAQWQDFDKRNTNMNHRDDDRGFYNQCFQKTSRQLAETIKIIGNNCRGGNDPDTGWIGLLRRRSDRKITSVFKSLTKTQDKKASVASYIRLFEPMVIKSLKQYSITSSIPLQCQVLMLLSQLVQLHINYCMLDSDQIFIDFVIKQFEFIEEGQIQQTEKLLPRIFEFLVRLSYEKYHSKNIIGVPKIIQLCDGLMASGQSPLTHCIPALVPVVEDIFLSRGSSTNLSEQKELETTHEVLISMLLRLVEYHEVIELVTLCLTECRSNSDGNGEEKWRRWSRSVMETLLPMLAAGKVRIESKEAHAAVVKLCATVSPTVFRPVDPLLKVLLTNPPLMGDKLVRLERWLGMVNIIFLCLISYAKEEAMLARLSDLSPNISDLSDVVLLPEVLQQSRDPLNALGNQLVELQPERILARFIFRVIKIIGARLSDLKVSTLRCNQETNEYFVHQSALFLQLCIHMFESGSHCKVANATVQMILGRNVSNEERIFVCDLNKLMLNIGNYWPILTCQWAYLMTLLSYSEMDFWSEVMGIEKSSPFSKRGKDSKTSVINMNIVRRGGTILFCDYVCENLNDAEPLTWLLVNHIEETIHLATEPPVRELVAVAVHRNSAASGLLIQAIATKCLDLSRPTFVKRLLLCVEGAHHSQSGSVIIALIPRLLTTKFLALSRMAANILSRRVEILLTLSVEDVNEQLPKEEFMRVMEILKETKLARKYGGLVSLLNKLGEQYYDLSPLMLDQCRSFNPSTIKNIQIDRNWFLSQVKIRCCYSNSGFSESAQLLSNLNYEECVSIFSSKDFSIKILKECIKIGVRSTVTMCQEQEFNSSGKVFDFIESPLYSAAKESLLQHVKNLNELIPKPHSIFDPQISSKYVTKFNELMEDTLYREVLFAVVPGIVTYFETLEKLTKFNLATIEGKFEEDLCKFATLCLETSHWIIENHENGRKKLEPSEIAVCLNCAREIMKNYNLSKIVGKDTHYHRVCSMTISLMRIVNHFHKTKKTLPCIEKRGLETALKSDDTKILAESCLRMATLVSWLEESTERIIPDFLYEPIESLIVSVSRLPLVNSFVLTPPLVWKYGWQMTGTGDTKCNFPLLSSEGDLIHEIEILEQFVFRVTLLGWTSRLQFEEIWMVFLSVVNILQNDDIAPEDINVFCQVTSLAVQAITRLLMQTLLLPCPGNPTNSRLIHHSRDPQLALYKISSQKLYLVQDLLVWKYECMNDFKNTRGLCLDNIFSRGNIERVTNGENLSYSQLSVAYLWSLCYLHEDKLCSSVLTLKNRRNDALVSSALDIDSCLRFLLELYTSWISPQVKIPLRLLKEVVQSILAISELFVERAQYKWMLDSCFELLKKHPVEDEILHQYLVIAVCKAAAVLTPLDMENLERIKRLLDGSLKSGFLPARISALHGMLYLLQSAVLANCEDTKSIVHPLAIEYIQKHIDVQESERVPLQSESHQGILWALVFFLLEHADDTPEDGEAPAVLELVLTLVTTQNISTTLHQTLLKGLERLVATRSVVGKVTEQIVKIAIDRLKQSNALLALPALQLMLTCMYTEAADRFNQPDIEEPLPDQEPEALVRSIERTSAIFDKIKKGYPMEVEILCTVLSGVLSDFFPPSEILTKVIGEFLSPQQPHQRLMSAVVFKVCERACNSAQLSLLQDWVVFSLPNFIQSLPVVLSTWCLSCFFISTSTNQWLRSLFPHVQSRIGKFEYEDKKLLCIAASDFYSKLTSETQKRTFVETFEEVAKEPGNPFVDILASL
ncbi:huntingtin [Leptopilina heterotoma]|uniref:huntingtin n=1 Tax=Leptopilina heterotoma TaxID=63436 RepID=UPI001CA8B8AA|nr:huntingtin [Leptopilina heterotoma]